MSKVYSSTNDFASLQRQAGDAIAGVRVGICAALAALWCKAQFEGARPLLTKPDYMRAQLLQVKYRWNPAAPGPDYVELFRDAQATAAISFQNLSVNVALGVMAANPGVYHLNEIGVHSTGAAVTGQFFYFYDSESGLYEFKSFEEWKTFINSQYAGIRWLGLKVTSA